MLHLGDWVIGVSALSCCEIGTEDNFWHVYCDSHTLYGLPHGLLWTHCDVQPSRGSGLKEIYILLHIHWDCNQTMREKKNTYQLCYGIWNSGSDYEIREWFLLLCSHVIRNKSEVSIRGDEGENLLRLPSLETDTWMEAHIIQ